MALNIDATSGATVFLAFVAALFCFIGFSTLGWSIMKMSIEDDESRMEVTVFVGLRRMCSEVSMSFTGVDDTFNDRACQDMDCKSLDEENCDHLSDAQIGASIATAGNKK
jgi:hypothetical protein